MLCLISFLDSATHEEISEKRGRFSNQLEKPPARFTLPKKFEFFFSRPANYSEAMAAALNFFGHTEKKRIRLSSPLVFHRFREKNCEKREG